MGSWFVMQESEKCHFHDVSFLSMCQEFCSQYWDDEKKTFGEMLVEVKEAENTPTYVRRCLEIQHTKVFRSFLITLPFITDACISIQCSCLGMKDNSHACTQTRSSFPQRKDSHTLQQYHFLKWAGHELPENPLDLVDMMKSVRQSGDRSKSNILPIVVHCK